MPKRVSQAVAANSVAGLGKGGYLVTAEAFSSLKVQT